MDRNKKQMFNEMLQEVLLKRITDIKHLEKKSNYKLEDWEELFGLIREQGNRLANKQYTPKPTPREIVEALNEYTSIDSIFIIYQGHKGDDSRTCAEWQVDGDIQDIALNLAIGIIQHPEIAKIIRTATNLSIHQKKEIHKFISEAEMDAEELF